MMQARILADRMGRMRVSQIWIQIHSVHTPHIDEMLDFNAFYGSIVWTD